MKCVVLLSVLLLASVGRAAVSGQCSSAADFFAKYNVSADDGDVAGPTCGGHCCSRSREGGLRHSLRRRVGARAAFTMRPIADLLLTTKNSLQKHLTELSHQSQNKTALFFTQIYKGHATKAHAPLSALFEDIRLVLITLQRDPYDFMTSPKDLSDSARNFFRDVFPVVYHNVLRLSNKQFTPEYETCLRDAYEAAQPFGDIPRQFGASLTRSLEAARALLQVLALGASTLSASERIIANARDDTCSNALLRVGGCAHCKGFNVLPCRNYCLNVARGCIGSLVSELEAPWSGYVEGVERLARATDADAALRTIDNRVSEAVMHALESQLILEKKVREECGAPSTIEDTSSNHLPTVTSRRDAVRAPPPDTELLEFAASLAASKKLFSGIADKFCEESDFAHEANDACWNGETVGGYTKALVASASISDQRYNPEVTGGAPQDPQVATLGDKLRKARQILVSHTSSELPAAEAFMQGDEAGEGSGSGGRGYDDDAAYDAEGSGDDGSGHGPDGAGPISSIEDNSVPHTAGSTISRPISILLVLTLLTSLTQTIT